MSSPAQIAARAEAPTPSIPRVRVRFGVLKSTVAFRGNITESKPTEIGIPKSVGDDDPMVTALYVKRGAIANNGELIFSVAVHPAEEVQVTDLTYRSHADNITSLRSLDHQSRLPSPA